MIARILHYVMGQAWAVTPEVGAIMVQLLAQRAAGVRLSADEVQARLEAATRPRERAVGAGDIAVLPLWGLISHRAHMVDDLSGPGGTSTEKFSRSFQAALGEPSIGAIVLDISSPGGSVEGITELAAEIRAARGNGKPIIAFANARAASAAYWIATAAEELWVTPSGDVGSIGVYGLHEDLSKALELEGIKPTFISAGKFKVEGNPFEPLTDEARKAMQATVDAYYQMFVRDVAKHRGVAVDAVRNGFGEGRMVLAKDAVAQNMADKVGTFPELVTHLRKRMTSSGASAEGGDRLRPAAEFVELVEAVAREAGGAPAGTETASTAETVLEADASAPAADDEARAKADADRARARLAIARARGGHTDAA